ncbi:50S ribosomal protein L3 [Candidatus Falkowbacteria bacterium]|nr:50S ribosomal protein L3 [Candidatus Falkowbacteria bacterium]
MKFILGKKLEMSQIFKDDGTVVPVTKVKAGPCQVTQVRNKDKDGYIAFQVGFGEKKKLNKPESGHLKKLGNYRYLIEFREDEKAELKKGDKITTAVFEIGDKVKVTGVSKGKGFQGVVRRHGFHGSPASHGHKDQLRMPGSIGATDPARVFPGKRMPGRMGGGQVTVTNLEIAKVEPENNLIYIKGAVPGARNSLLRIVGLGEMKLDVQENKKTKNQEIKDEEGGSGKVDEIKKEDEKK